jgi:NADPH-dependent ferric siderophore reductase
MAFSHATVTDSAPVTSRMRRIGLRVHDPVALDVAVGPDAAVGVYFPGDAGGRNYSVRRHDGDRIDIDVVLHGHGPGTDWAHSCTPGTGVGLDHSRSWYSPEPVADWQLLVTDMSGMPATARIVEALPDGHRATVVVEVPDRDELGYLPSHPDVDVIESIGTGNGRAPSRLGQLVREFAHPSGRGYCWYAGEAAEARVVRKHLRGLGWTPAQLDVMGYWRFDSEAWDAKFATVADDVVAVYTRALAEGKDEKVASEEFDEALERAGL